MSNTPRPRYAIKMKYRVLLVAAALAVPALSQSFRAERVTNPSAKGSLQPNWSVAPDGAVVLSWIEPSANGSYALRYAVRHGSQWSEARTIASRRHFFRQPAEVPEVMQIKDRLWMAHWVEMPMEESDAENVYVSSSADGVHWTPPSVAHKDRSPVQHGLASMSPSGNDEVSVVWLEALHGEDEPTFLMRTIVNSAGKEVREERLDADVCSCCPTTIVRTAKGLLVAYRDHTPQDIRDISVIRFENGRWSQPKTLHADNWKLNACPTNAAAVAAKGDHVAIAWFTGAQDSPRVEIAFSADSGSTFSKPAIVSTGPAFGYTSVALDDDGSAIVSWLEKGGQAGTRVLVRRITPAGAAGPVIQIAEGGRMALGYPRIVHSTAGTFVAWGDSKQIQTAQLKK
jgi:BNR repeat-like domain